MIFTRENSGVGRQAEGKASLVPFLAFAVEDEDSFEKTSRQASLMRSGQGCSCELCIGQHAKRRAIYVPCLVSTRTLCESNRESLGPFTTLALAALLPLS